MHTYTYFISEESILPQLYVTRRVFVHSAHLTLIGSTYFVTKGKTHNVRVFLLCDSYDVCGIQHIIIKIHFILSSIRNINKFRAFM